jgi:glyoxylate reductase
MRSDRLMAAVTRRLPEVVERRMDELFDVELRTNDAPMTRPELVETVKRVDILVPCVTDTIDTSLLAQAGPQLKLIANFGAGLTISMSALPYGAGFRCPTLLELWQMIRLI